MSHPTSEDATLLKQEARPAAHTLLSLDALQVAEPVRHTDLAGFRTHATFPALGEEQASAAAVLSATEPPSPIQQAARQGANFRTSRVLLGLAVAVPATFLLARTAMAPPDQQPAVPADAPEVLALEDVGTQHPHPPRTIAKAPPPTESLPSIPPQAVTPPAPEAPSEPRTVREESEVTIGIAAAPQPQLEPREALAVRTHDESPVDWGYRLFKAGDVDAAREVFEQAANEGVRDAAFAMGVTYDPKSLAEAGLTHVKPDQLQALYWYRRAHILSMRKVKREQPSRSSSKRKAANPN